MKLVVNKNAIRLFRLDDLLSGTVVFDIDSDIYFIYLGRKDSMVMLFDLKHNVISEFNRNRSFTVVTAELHITH